MLTVLKLVTEESVSVVRVVCVLMNFILSQYEILIFKAWFVSFITSSFISCKSGRLLWIVLHLPSWLVHIFPLYPSDHHWEASHEFPRDGGWNTGCVGRWRCVRVAHIGFSLKDHTAVNTTFKRWFSDAVTRSQYHEVGARLSIKNMSQLADGLVGHIPKVTVWSELEIRDDITLKDYLLDCTM